MNDAAEGRPARAVMRPVTICNRRGLHARAAARFVKLAGEFDAEVWVRKNGTEVSGRSIMGLMMLAAGPGTIIELRRSLISCAVGSMRGEGSQRRPERELHGLGVAPGIAIGPAFISEDGELPVAERKIEAGEVARERQRFEGAVHTSMKQLKKLRVKAAALPESAAKEMAELLEAHQAMLAQWPYLRPA